MDLTALHLCTDCPGFIEGIWAALAVVAIGALITLLVAAPALADRARGKAFAILAVGGIGTLWCAHVAASGIWRLLDPGTLG